MGAIQRPRDLVNFKEFAKLAGISESTARLYRNNYTAKKTPSLPKPDKIINHRFYWFRKTAEKWAATPRPTGYHAQARVKAKAAASSEGLIDADGNMKDLSGDNP